MRADEVYGVQAAGPHFSLGGRGQRFSRRKDFRRLNIFEAGLVCQPPPRP